MKIQANHSGTRSIEVTEKHLQTIDEYALPVSYTHLTLPTILLV